MQTDGFDDALGASYRLLDEQGQGATGTVWRAVDRRTDEVVAAKLLREEHTADQELVVRNHYNAKLAVMNIGDGFTTGPAEAAYVINELVKPASVIASHANEVGTVGGKVRPGSKTEAFVKASKVPVVIPLSGKTMEFDAGGKCTAGC